VWGGPPESSLPKAGAAQERTLGLQLLVLCLIGLSLLSGHLFPGLVTVSCKKDPTAITVRAQPVTLPVGCMGYKMCSCLKVGEQWRGKRNYTCLGHRD
jgi:hypothetical protein